MSKMEQEDEVAWRGWCGGEPLLVPVDHEWIAGESFSWGLLRAAGKEGDGYWALKWSDAHSEYRAIFFHENSDQAALRMFSELTDDLTR
ncbi:hypothetical protein [Thauera sp.]|jgi:hypothetical protein|uniref:hypothetical protein n=1 Tax=Thauera sp. TaxID=1905334 RepID=UPI00262484C3|nr:hypothetical protein [Thauera sp.]